jgi:ribosome-binding factor A
MERAAEAIRETVSTTVLFGLRDPRVKNVTVLGSEVTQDLRAAKIFVTIMGDAKAQSLAMHGLNSARGFIQAKVADRLQTKHTPEISFVLDPSVKKSIEVSRTLSGLVGESSESVEDEFDEGED